MSGTGIRATHGGRTFEVAPDGRDQWREVDERGRRIGPVLHRADFDDMARVTTRGRLDGHDVEVRPSADGRVAVRGLPLPREVVEAHGLTGNPRDGWVGTVDPADLTDVHEERQEMRTDV